ncbi:MAG TPA: GTP cyclohydrolase II [Campylobacterales bacterium]|nr:GTP cyclohydrolase II [Campylobacterales bacterium]HIO70557.1 GTP cyclohydrolase II [Campylobacterales bacterium]
MILDDEVEISKVAKLPTKFGNFIIQAFKEKSSGKEHLAIWTENIENIEAPLARIHSECLTGDAFGSLKCDCGDQFHSALSRIQEEGGILLYLRQEGRNIGLLNKVNAYHLQDLGLNTIEANHQLGFEADERRYDIADYIFQHLNIGKIRLLTNNPQKLSNLRSVEIVERVPIVIKANSFNREYLEVKKLQMGHLL